MFQFKYLVFSKQLSDELVDCENFSFPRVTLLGAFLVVNEWCNYMWKQNDLTLSQIGFLLASAIAARNYHA